MILQIGEFVIHKTYNQHMDIVRRDRRVIARLFKNIRGAQLVEWASKRERGVCALDTWTDWHNGVNENFKRGFIK